MIDAAAVAIADTPSGCSQLCTTASYQTRGAGFDAPIGALLAPPTAGIALGPPAGQRQDDLSVELAARGLLDLTAGTTPRRIELRALWLVVSSRFPMRREPRSLGRHS